MREAGEMKTPKAGMIGVAAVLPSMADGIVAHFLERF
jgi:hypothetical protein